MPINCIDPKCGSRSNSIDKEQCKCGTLILLKSRYRVLDRIGKSSHVYEVFIAEDTRENNKIVAIKTLADSDNKKYRKFFYREQQILEDHKYSCLPDLFDYGDEHSVSSRPKILYFVMEFIAGQTLSQWLKTQENKKLSHETAWEWLKNITKTLTELHDQKHLHLDLKPDNIMLREDDSTQKLELVLIDFSIDGSRGTGVYKAPERNNGVKNTPMVDFFSFGQTFVYLTTGEEPETFNPGDNWADRTAFSSSPIINVINWMKEQDPVNRPQTTYQILYAIDVLSKPKSDGRSYTQEDANNLINNIRDRTLQRSQLQEKDRRIQNLDTSISEINQKLTIQESLLQDQSVQLLNKDREIQVQRTSIERINDRLVVTTRTFINQCNALANKVRLYKRIIIIGLVGGFITINALIFQVIQLQFGLQKAETALEKTAPNFISYGERDLDFFGNGDQNFHDAELKAIKTFKEGGKNSEKYRDAFTEFKDLYFNYNETVAKSHPEIAIFMNNAKVRYLHSLSENKSKILYRIAVASPVDNETGQHILFGVGLKQQLLINNTSNPKENETKILPKIYLEIGIADDKNNKNGLAKIVSKQLAGDSHIRAVIGHYSTEATQAALEDYCENRLAIVSPTASADGLRNKCQQNNDVFFRTVSSTQIEAKLGYNF
jgi:serine/threonine protein kinase